MDKNQYKNAAISLIEKIHNEESLKLIYKYIEYLFVYGDETSGKEMNNEKKTANQSNTAYEKHN